MGSILTSYHQPFHGPGAGLLALVDDPGRGQWRMLHVLSDSCGCSQRVMQHLLARHAVPGVTEQVLLIEDEGSKLSGGDELVARLGQEGFRVTRIAARSIPAESGMRGVPLLIVASPGDKIAYMGGYGMRGDQDATVFQTVRSGAQMKALPVLGCAVGSRVRRQADPFGLKY
jgi:hypothetical protein